MSHFYFKIKQLVSDIIKDQCALFSQLTFGHKGFSNILIFITLVCIQYIDNETYKHRHTPIYYFITQLIPSTIYIYVISTTIYIYISLFQFLL